MKLISLQLKNFRQHIDTSINFSDGVTAIVGPNGSGKSTILEAIAWALYGANALRGNNDTVRSNASEAGAKPGVELVFDLSGSICKVTRGLDASGRSGTATLEINGVLSKSGPSEVADAISKILGMDYKAFFTSFFTSQKELEFMPGMDKNQRAISINRMLGYDRLVRAKDAANEDRKGLDREIEGLEKGLPDLDEIKERKKTIQNELDTANEAFKISEKTHELSKKAFEQLKPIKEAAEQKSKLYEEKFRSIKISENDIVSIESDIEKLRKEINDLKTFSAELDSYKDDMKRFEDAKTEYKQLQDLQVHESEKQKMIGQITALEDELKLLNNRTKTLSNVDDMSLRADLALSEAENLLKKLDSDLSSKREERIANQQSISTQIAQHEKNLIGIQHKRDQIEEAGADGKCPTCERPLAEELQVVLQNFDKQISEIKNHIENLNNQNAQLVSFDKVISELQLSRDSVEKQIVELRREKSKCDSEKSEFMSIKQQIESRNVSLNELKLRLDFLPKGFDQARFTELRKIGTELEPKVKRSVEIKTLLSRQPEVESNFTEKQQMLIEKKDYFESLKKSILEINFNQSEFEKIVTEYEELSGKLSETAVDLERKRGECNTLSALLNQVVKEEENYKLKAKDVEAKRVERLHLATLTSAFDALRSDLNDRIRPELEAIASEILASTTDGRYSVVEIDENYKAWIYDDNERKPVISGGEDDILNLSLRLAISQMITERAGQQFSLLVLDEVFGSLDDVRRENVVSMLQNLKNRFEQIILITHIESIHDAVDSCLWVEFDEKNKVSKLQDRLQIDISDITN